MLLGTACCELYHCRYSRTALFEVRPPNHILKPIALLTCETGQLNYLCRIAEGFLNLKCSRLVNRGQKVGCLIKGCEDWRTGCIDGVDHKIQSVARATRYVNSR